MYPCALLLFSPFAPRCVKMPAAGSANTNTPPRQGLGGASVLFGSSAAAVVRFASWGGLVARLLLSFEVEVAVLVGPGTPELLRPLLTRWRPAQFEFLAFKLEDTLPKLLFFVAFLVEVDGVRAG